MESASKAESSSDGCYQDWSSPLPSYFDRIAASSNASADFVYFRHEYRRRFRRPREDSGLSNPSAGAQRPERTGGGRPPHLAGGNELHLVVAGRRLLRDREH